MLWALTRLGHHLAFQVVVFDHGSNGLWRSEGDKESPSASPCDEEVTLIRVGVLLWCLELSLRPSHNIPSPYNRKAAAFISTATIFFPFHSLTLTSVSLFSRLALFLRSLHSRQSLFLDKIIRSPISCCLVKSTTMTANEHDRYNYNPSTSAAIVVAALYSIVFVITFVQWIRYRAWVWVVMVIASASRCHEIPI